MARRNKGPLQDRQMTLRVSGRFLEGLDRATEAAGEPSATQFIRKAVIALAAKHGVKVER